MKLPHIIDFKANEAELLRLLRKGSKEAFEEIFKFYWKDIYKHACSKLRCKEEAEEIVQEIFTTLWDKREQLLITNLTYYLHTSVKNKVLNILRSQIVQDKYWEYYKVYLTGENTITEETVYYNDLKKAVEKGTSFLSSKAKTIFQLSRMEGYTTSEIAKRLNISEKTVEYHITRSARALNTYLKDYRSSILILSSSYYLI
jgi:RNA polymerase sigma-70 factor (ECF subfamily)